MLMRWQRRSRKQRKLDDLLRWMTTERYRRFINRSRFSDEDRKLLEKLQDIVARVCLQGLKDEVGVVIGEGKEKHLPLSPTLI